MIDKKSLKIIKAVTEEKSFHKAASLCFISASGVTRQIQKIEQTLNCILFERDNRNIKITEAGRIVYQYTLKALQNYEDLEHRLHPSGKNIQGEIQLFCTVTASYIVAPRIAKALQANYPNIKLKLQTGSLQVAAELLKQHKTDAAILMLSNNLSDDFVIKKILSTRMTLVAPIGNKVISIKDAVTKLPFIMPPKSTFLHNELITQWLNRHTDKLNFYGEVDGSEAILSLVSAGLGISIIPKVVALHNPSTYEVKTFDLDDFPQLEVGIVMEKRTLKSPVKNAFWQLCQSLPIIHKG